MKFNIINIALVCTVALPVSAAPRPKKAAPQARATLVWSRGLKLEASRLNGGSIVVLRERVASEYAPPLLPQWSFSPHGRQLAFVDAPDDVDFFDAGAYRQYLFLARFDTASRVLLAAYGPRAVGDGASFVSPSFDTMGHRLVVEEDEIGQMMSSSSHHWVSIYDIRTRRRVFDSRQFVKNLPVSKVKSILSESLLESPSLSPDGNDLLCLATPDDGDSVADSVVYPPQLVHFDLKRKSAEILISPNGHLPSNRKISTDKIQMPDPQPDVLWAGFAWHPIQKKFVFASSSRLQGSPVNLFTFDLTAHKITRCSHSEQDQNDFSPQWSPDGKQLFWIRGGFEREKLPGNQIFRADADGSNVEAILPQVKGMTKIQLLPQIADWSRYRKLSIAPLAGKDK